MNSSTQKLVLEAVKTAIITELRGLEIYQAAAAQASDPAAKQMFRALAEDEKAHKDFLEANYRSLLSTGEWSVPATPANLSPLEHSEIITPEFLQRVKGGSFEVGVIATGVLLEKTAIDFYRTQAVESPDPAARETFQFLADWEKGHLESLTELERRLRDQYFADQGFSPF